jgi:Xaa-Pro aminopeptidase
MRLRNPKSKIQNPKLLLAATLVLFAAAALALDFPPLTPSKDAFKARREKFLAKVAPNSLAVLHSAPTRLMSNDTDYVYRQDSTFYYLTGIEEPDTTAVFRPDAPDGKRYILFVRGHDARREAYEGPRPGPDGAAAEYGADAAFASGEIQNRLASFDPATRIPSGYLAGAERLYLADGGDTEWAERFRASRERMRARDMGPATLVDAREIVNEMRLVKDAEEIRFLRRAAEISARGHVLAMKAVAPGKWEFEVQQALDGYCFANGVRRMAYPSIAGSGPDSCFLHWDKSNRQMKEGEVLLNDSGAEYGMYATDITRTYPVSGRFSVEQKAIYEIVLDAQKKAMARVKPGLPHAEIEKTCARVQTEGLVKLGLLSGDVEKILLSNGHRRFTLHGVSHWVGLDVHDAGRYVSNEKPRPLEPGMVFTIEPGIYIPANSQGVDPKWWNIGVRIEDTVLVTPEGYECLSCAAPREIADVEKTVQSGRN